MAYLRTIKKILPQQRFLLDHPASELRGRIVSLHKPYLRPIVRGKENKRVEFGMKAHVLQIGGLDFIDKLDFDNFNECTRLKISTLKHTRWFGQTSQLGADRIYATNANRRFCSQRQVFTCFPKKGPKGHRKDEKILAREISRQRATAMEGTFGNHKLHYGLGKIKVKGPNREKLAVLFGIMAANAVKVARSRKLRGSPPISSAA